MHIPASHFHQQLVNEGSGIWFVPSMGDATHAILLKAYSNVLKAVSTGCKIEIGFATITANGQKVLASYAYLYDDPKSPIALINPHLTREEQDSVIAILQCARTPITLFDELVRPVASAYCLFDDGRHEVVNLIGDASLLYSGELTPQINSALDDLQKFIDRKLDGEKPSCMAFARTLAVTFEQFVGINIHVIGSRGDVHEFNALGPDEGSGFEKSVWHALDNLFGTQTYRSPQVITNSKQRELIDLLAFTDLGVFLFETKAVGVFSSKPERNTDRRAITLESQIEKALRQLVGAISVIRSDARIQSPDGLHEIRFNRKIVPHGIVVVSEMLPAASWNDIAFKVMQAALDSSSMIQVVDLHELFRLVAASKTPDYFDHYLMKRFEAVVEQKNALVRVKFVE